MISGILDFVRHFCTLCWGGQKALGTVVVQSVAWRSGVFDGVFHVGLDTCVYRIWASLGHLLLCWKWFCQECFQRQQVFHPPCCCFEELVSSWKPAALPPGFNKSNSVCYKQTCHFLFVCSRWRKPCPHCLRVIELQLSVWVSEMLGCWLLLHSVLLTEVQSR